MDKNTFYQPPSSYALLSKKDEVKNCLHSIFVDSKGYKKLKDSSYYTRTCVECLTLLTFVNSAK
jgi:hypothetical protein